jgi:hypothetical protein
MTQGRQEAKNIVIVAVSLRVGVNQGFVLAPTLLGNFVNAIIDACNAADVGALYAVLVKIN